MISRDGEREKRGKASVCVRDREWGGDGLQKAEEHLGGTELF